jgi:hypothetical protein
VADEVQGSVTGGNGERLELRLGTKSLGVSAKDLVPILLLIMMGGGGYLLYTNVMSHIDKLAHGQASLQENMHENRETILRSVQDWRVVMEGQTAHIRHLLQIHEYNQDRALGDRLPLEVDPQQLPPRQPRP